MFYVFRKVPQDTASPVLRVRSRAGIGRIHAFAMRTSHHLRPEALHDGAVQGFAVVRVGDVA
jgi:hypothetical protein